jgi:hypothetical protein
VKYVGLHCPLLPYSLPIWKAGTSGTGNFSQRYPQPWKTANQIFVLPREAAEQNRHTAAFFCRKGSRRA